MYLFKRRVITLNATRINLSIAPTEFLSWFAVEPNTVNVVTRKAEDKYCEEVLDRGTMEVGRIG